MSSSMGRMTLPYIMDKKCLKTLKPPTSQGNHMGLGRYPRWLLLKSCFSSHLWQDRIMIGSCLGDFEHHFQVPVGDCLPNSRVMFGPFTNPSFWQLLLWQLLAPRQYQTQTTNPQGYQQPDPRGDILSGVETCEFLRIHGSDIINKVGKYGKCCQSRCHIKYYRDRDIDIDVEWCRYRMI